MRNQKKPTKPELSDAIGAILKFTGLYTGLKPTFGVKTANNGSENIESFLPVTEITLLKEAFQRRNYNYPNKKTR